MIKKVKNNGFTLVEVLIVLVIMSLLIVVAVPGAKGISDRISKRSYATKIELATHGAQLWAENNQNCFTCTSGECSNKCSNAVCQTDSSDLDEKICEIKLGFLASEKYFNYDDQELKKIINPVNNEIINNETITVIYNKRDGSFKTDISAEEYSTLYFNGNGAEGGYLGSITCKNDLPCALPENTFVIDGNEFAGWSYQAIGGVTYQPGMEITINKDTTMYASWRGSRYVLVFNSNDATGHMESKICDHGVPCTLPNNNFTKAHHDFIGWGETPDGSAMYANGGQTTLSENTTLYAKWALKKYDLAFSGNTSTSGTMSPIKCEHDTNCQITSNGFAKTGHTFAGWALSSSGATTYSNSSNIKITSNTTLYAKWTANTYSVTYNANGGSSAPSAQTKTYGVNLNLSTSTPTRTGYTFAGWNTNSSGTGTNYSSGASYTGNAALTLYARWTANTYSVTYNANGGSGAPAAQTKTYGVNLTLSTVKPTRTGYTFAGWNTNSSGTGTNYASGATYTGNAAVTLYARWTANTYSVTYNANGGSGAPAAQTKTYGVNLTLTTAKPTRTGHTFANWNTNSSGTGTNYSSGASYTSNAALTLYAKWTVNKYTISFSANGGSGAPAAQTKTYGVAMTLTTVRPTRTGYTFKGWATTSGATTAAYASGASYTGNAAATLYAVWKDETPPTCGSQSPATSTVSWTNTNKTFSVGCSDAGTGCKATTVSRTFTTDTDTGTITIEDKAGNTRNCSVTVKIDKSKPYTPRLDTVTAGQLLCLGGAKPTSTNCGTGSTENRLNDITCTVTCPASSWNISGQFVWNGVFKDQVVNGASSGAGWSISRLDINYYNPDGTNSNGRLRKNGSSTSVIYDVAGNKSSTLRVHWR